MSIKISPTRSEKSSWTPKNHVPSNQKIFKERLALIKKWYAAWSKDQRWSLFEYILKQLDDEQLLFIHSLLQPTIPILVPDYDFTRTLPRFLSLKIFSMLDPQTLCRASQVCWYWKHLAESNEIWQEKCLRLNWFLPTPPPPQMCDYTLWKRHYIACVCQLHWNPPQLRADECDEDYRDSDAATATEELESSKKASKKRTTRHLVNDEAKKPWRDPDPQPADIQYCYKIQSASSPLYSRFPSLRSRTQASTEYTPCTPVTGTHTPSPLPPLSALLHPTLMEKMRLNSPTSAHRDLATLNRQQTESEISETLYRLQEASPFPKLPPYFVHRLGGSTQDESVLGSAQNLQGGLSNMDDNTHSRPPSGRPPSGKSSVSIVTPSECSNRNTPLESSQKCSKAAVSKEEALPTKAWHIQYEDEENY